jgi:hypothetical protein
VNIDIQEYQNQVTLELGKLQNENILLRLQIQQLLEEKEGKDGDK